MTEATPPTGTISDAQTPNRFSGTFTAADLVPDPDPDELKEAIVSHAWQVNGSQLERDKFDIKTWEIVGGAIEYEVEHPGLGDVPPYLRA